MVASEPRQMVSRFLDERLKSPSAGRRNRLPLEFLHFRGAGRQRRVADLRLPKGQRAGYQPNNATRFSSPENSAKIVGRTPRSARVPLDPLFANRMSLIHNGQ